MRKRRKPPHLFLPLLVCWQQRRGMARLIVAISVFASVLGFFFMSAHNNEIPTLVARKAPVRVNRPFNCVSKTKRKKISTTDTGMSAVYEPKNPRRVEGFPATPVILDGFLGDDVGVTANAVSSFDGIFFFARSSKLPNGPILSTGSSMLFNTENDQYRLLRLKASLNYTAIRDNEGVESDVCVTVVQQTKSNSVSSGEEVFCTHEHYYGGDDGSVGQITFDFLPGGFPLLPRTKLDVASVSKIFGPKAPLDDKSVRERDAPAKPVPVAGLGDVATSLDLLALNFEALIVPSDANAIHGHDGLRSVRSPFRDRSFFPMPHTETMPLTEFRNTEEGPISIRGLGIFRSMLDHYVAGDTLIRVLVDGVEVHRLCPVPHRPGEKSAPFHAVVPLLVEVASNSTIRVEHTLSAFMPGSTLYMPTSYDLAVYILYEQPDSSSSDALVPINEDALGDGQLDLNGDGILDVIDYDTHGDIWVAVASSNGAYDTQHSAMYTGNLITKKGKFNRPTTLWRWSRSQDGLMEAKVTDHSNNLCFYLRFRTPEIAVFEYCDESAVPYTTYIEGSDEGSDESTADRKHCIGDFDGDGHLDRIRVKVDLVTSDISLYFAKGDGTRYVSEHMVATLRDDCQMLQCRYQPSEQVHLVWCRGRRGWFFTVDILSLLW